MNRFSKKKARALALMVGILAAMGWLAYVPPDRLDELPRLCLWARVLGRPCPGCGTTHALGALLHGQFRRAWDYNRNVILVAPVLAWIWIGQLRVLVRRSSADTSTSFPARSSAFKS
jgi:hypothetical protein